MTAPREDWLGDQPAEVLTAAELDRRHADDIAAWDQQMRDHIRTVALGEVAE